MLRNDTPTAAPPAGSRLHFMKRGEQVVGNTMAAGSTADLVFRLGAPANALAVVDHPAVDAACRADTGLRGDGVLEEVVDH